MCSKRRTVVTDGIGLGNVRDGAGFAKEGWDGYGFGKEGIGLGDCQDGYGIGKSTETI